MSDSPTHLGPFVLGEQIGAGGMSEVFAGTHRNTGELVALKITRFGRGQTSPRRAFVAEIASMARMYHPGIVQIHDWGVLPDGAGNWCAMDFAPLGALRPGSLTGWGELKELLQQILDALGHAHARGVVHRDLKPQNVLVFGHPNAVSYRLADFGLAHSRLDRDRAEVTGVVAGTPAYMAPEQLHGLWREFGPWTDLYALGCMAFELATGRTPFRGASPVEVALAHLRDPLPVMVPRFAVPDGFQDWVHALLGRDWIHRPYNAVVARVALDRLRAPASEYHAREMQPLDDLVATFELLPTQLAETLVEFGLTPSLSLALQGEAPPFDDVPIPDDWRTTGGSSARFGDAGSELFPFRRTELVGHLDQREALWNQLKQVVLGSAPHVAILEGEPDRERQQIAEWLLTRVREVTTVQTISLDLSSAAYGRDPFREAIEALLTAEGLSKERLREHLTRSLSRQVRDVQPLLERVVELFETEQPMLSELRARAVFWEILLAAAERGPLLLWVHAADRNVGTWFLIERILYSRDLPIHLIVTPQQRRGELSYSETKVREHPHTMALSPQKLDEEAAGYVLDTYINLVPELRARWTRLAAEDLPFAVDVLRFATVLRGLVPTPDGYELLPGVEIPSTLGELTSVRMRVLKSVRPSAARALGLAASIGPAVSFDAWSEVAESVGAQLGNGDIDVLIRQGFLRETRGSYEFEDPRIRTLILAHLPVSDLDRLLQTWRRTGLSGLLGRVDLLLAKGDEPAAAAALVDYVAGKARRDDATFASWTEAAERVAHASPTLQTWLLVVETRAARNSVQLGEVAARADVAPVRFARQELLSAQAVQWCYDDELVRAEEQCTALLEELPDATLLRAEVCATLGWLRLRLPDSGTADALLDEALSTYVGEAAWGEAALAALHLGLAHTVPGEYDRARDYFDRAYELAAKASAGVLLPRVLLERSTARLLMEDADLLEDAEEAFRLGVWATPALRGSFGASLAMCLAHVGDFERADEVLRESETLLRPDHERARTQIRATRYVIVAMAGDVEAWDRMVEHPPPRADISVFRDNAVAAWERHGDAARAEQASRHLSSSLEEVEA